MRRTINADGELIEVGSNDTTTAALVSNSGTIDFFGFNLEWRQFLVALVLASLMLGIQGGKLLIRDVFYHSEIFCRFIPSHIRPCFIYT
jgi:hypothetical protein